MTTRLWKKLARIKADPTGAKDFLIDQTGRVLASPATRRRARESGIDLATVVGSRRSAPRPIGSSLAVTASGKLCGSVSGGCVEGDVAVRAREVLDTGEPQLLSYGISDDEAFGVGLTCGGIIHIFVERVDW